MWGGILFAVAGESILFVLADAGGGPTVNLGWTSFALSTGWAIAAASIAGFTWWTAWPGEGLPTALVTWMFLKSLAITGLIVHHLGASLPWVLPFFGVFVLGMTISRPSHVSS